MIVGFVSGQPPPKAQRPQGLGARGEDLPPLPQRTKKGRTKPQSGTTFSSAIETSKPCERVHKKTKSNSYCETGLRGNEPWLFRMGGAVMEKCSRFQGLKSRAYPSGNQWGRWLGWLLCEPLNVILGNSLPPWPRALSWLLRPGREGLPGDLAMASVSWTEEDPGESC